MRRRRQHYVEMHDDGMVALPHGKLATPEEAHYRARNIMAGFDDLPYVERCAWNYATVSHQFNPSVSPKNYSNKRDKNAIAARGVKYALDDMGLL